MRKSLILIPVVGFVGVGLAVLLFALMPLDTGEVPDLERVEVAPVPVAGMKPPTAPLMGRPGTGPDRAAPEMHVGEGNGVNPVAAEGVERRAMPDAQAAGKASAPWSLIRRTLLNETDEQSQQILEASGQLIQDFRQARRDPDSVDFAALEARHTALVEQLRSSRHASNPTIAGALERVDTIFEEYHQAIGD